MNSTAEWCGAWMDLGLKVDQLCGVFAHQNFPRDQEEAACTRVCLSGYDAIEPTLEQKFPCMLLTCKPQSFLYHVGLLQSQVGKVCPTVISLNLATVLYYIPFPGWLMIQVPRGFLICRTFCAKTRNIPGISGQNHHPVLYSLPSATSYCCTEGFKANNLSKVPKQH